MEFGETINIGGWSFGETGENILTSLTLESVENSENIVARNIGHGSFAHNAFFSKQRLNASILFLADSETEAYEKARMFSDYVAQNFYSNNGDLLKFTVNDRCGFGVFTSLTPCKFDSTLKHGGATVEFDFTFLHPYFYSTQTRTHNINSDSLERFYGLQFPAREFRFSKTTGVVQTESVIVNDGSVSAPLKITFPNGGVNPILNIGDRNIQFEFSTNKKVTVDAKTNQILIDGSFVSNVFKFGESITDLVLPPGAFRASVNGRTTTGGSVTAIVEVADTFKNI